MQCQVLSKCLIFTTTLPERYLQGIVYHWRKVLTDTPIQLPKSVVISMSGLAGAGVALVFKVNAASIILFSLMLCLGLESTFIDRVSMPCKCLMEEC